MEVETKAGWISAVRQLGKAVGENGGGEVTSNDITDATEVGKNVITAATQEAARDAIGAGTSDFSGSYADLSDKPTIPAATTVDNLGGAGTTGKVVMKATDAEAARTAIGAGTSNLAIGTTAQTAKAGDYSPPFATESIGGLMQATDKAKLNGIAAGATALTIGTTATTAMAGNTPIPAAATWANLSGKPATFPPTIGTTASTAKAGNYTPTTNEVSASLKAKAEIAALTEIAAPAEASAEDIASAVNAIIAALKA